MGLPLLALYSESLLSKKRASWGQRAGMECALLPDVSLQGEMGRYGVQPFGILCHPESPCSMGRECALLLDILRWEEIAVCRAWPFFLPYYLGSPSSTGMEGAPSLAISHEGKCPGVKQHLLPMHIACHLICMVGSTVCVWDGGGRGAPHHPSKSCVLGDYLSCLYGCVGPGQTSNL